MSLLYVLIVGALLENEAISGLSEGKPTGVRRTSNSAEMVWTPDDLIAVVSCTLHPCSLSFSKTSGLCVALYQQILASVHAAGCIVHWTISLFDLT